MWIGHVDEVLRVVNASTSSRDVLGVDYLRRLRK